MGVPATDPDIRDPLPVMQAQGIALAGAETHSTPVVQAELAAKNWPLDPVPTRATDPDPVPAIKSPLVVTVQQRIGAGPEDAEVTMPKALTQTVAFM